MFYCYVLWARIWGEDEAYIYGVYTSLDSAERAFRKLDSGMFGRIEVQELRD